MSFDFNYLINRKNTGSLKWEVEDDVIPMWVADMEFETAPCIIEALQKRVEHGVFGYNIVPIEWNQAIVSWWKNRYGFEMEEEWLLFCTGVVPAISSIIRKLTTVAENILVLTPVYNIFFNSIFNNGRNIQECHLLYQNGNYDINWEELEEKLSNSQTTMMILCNPHNPIGKIWSKEQLFRIAQLCEKYSVIVISDEIHCDLVSPGKQYIPFASINTWAMENSITCIAPTKTFNLAGIQTAAICIPNEKLRQKVERGINTDEVAEPNSFAIIAAITAYREGGEWLDALLLYIEENKRLVQKFIEDHIPEMSIVQSEATYLVWIDCQSITKSSREFCERLKTKFGVYLASGDSYGKCGEGFLRMNIACSKKQLLQGLERLKNGVQD